LLHEIKNKNKNKQKIKYSTILYLLLYKMSSLKMIPDKNGFYSESDIRNMGSPEKIVEFFIKETSYQDVLNVIRKEIKEDKKIVDLNENENENKTK
jgi:hypothetical protein